MLPSPSLRGAVCAFACASLALPAAAQLEIHDLETTPTGAYKVDLWSGATSGTYGHSDDLLRLPLMVTLGARSLFVANRPEVGVELFVTDGTPGGSEVLLDAIPGPGDGLPRCIIQDGGVAYFLAVRQGYEGAQLLTCELYVTDGTAAGTAPVVDLSLPGMPIGFRDTAVPVLLANGRMLIRGLETPTSTAVYSIDPVTGDVIKLANSFYDHERVPLEIEPVADGSGAFFFGGQDEDRLLYSTDGFSATVLAQHPTPDVGPLAVALDYSKGLFTHGDLTYVPGVDSVNGLGLYSVDKDLVSAPQLILAFQPDSVNGEYLDLRRSIALGGSILGEVGFFDFQFTHLKYGTFAYDPVTGSSPLVHMTLQGVLDRGPQVQLGERAFYIRKQGWAFVLESIGPSGVVEEATIAPSELGPFGGAPWTASAYFRLGDRLVYAKHEAANGTELWSTDGVGGDVLEARLPEGYREFWPVAFAPMPSGELRFWAQDALGRAELFTSQLGGDTAVHVDTLLQVTPSLSSRPFGFTALGSETMLLLTEGDESAPEVAAWAHHADGSVERLTPPGVEVVASAKGLEFVTGFAVDTGRAGLVGYFVAEDPTSGAEIWRTDGTAAGTGLAFDLTPGPTGTDVRAMHVHAGALYFVAERPGIDPPGQAQLWKRSATGNLQLTTMGAGGELASLGAALLFQGDAPETGRELWQTDGTVAGTGLLMELRAGSAGSFPQFGAELDGRVVFTANDGAFGREPWGTDGTVAGTERLVDLVPAFFSSETSHFAAGSPGKADEAFFYSHEFGGEIFLTDGTAAGTFSVAMPVVGELVTELEVVERGGWWWFVFAESAGGKLYPNVWRTNGTAVVQITALGVPVEAGVSTAFGPIRGLAATETRTVALIDDPVEGLEVFDLGASATLFLDSVPGPVHADALGAVAPIAARELGLLNGAALFRQTDPDRGHELYVQALHGGFVDNLGGRGFEGAQLSMPAPRIGKSPKITVESAPVAPGGSLHLVFYSQNLSSPAAVPGLGSGVIWLDPASLQLVKVSALPDFTQTFSLPNDPTLVGVEAHLQAVSLELQSGALVTSNGLHVRVGS